ncbi:MAG: PAS domain-containing protein [Desulfobacterales bacterium]|nr:PAS domain-containing protein [Desulfobacterales bacterium]
MVEKKKRSVGKNKTEPSTPLSVKKSVEEKKTAIRALKNGTGFPIVGLGASAGGLEALETFFTHTPSDSGIAFVIIQHLSPKHKSIMSSLLSKYTEMAVLDLEDGMKIQPNQVYLNPPDKNVVIINGVFQLMTPVKTSGINLPIDFFFRSMAEDLGEKAICIILSGTATDGTLGLRAVKGEGGIAMVQDPDSARYDGMPRSAMATGIVDFILPVEKLPEQLIKFVKAPYISTPSQTRVKDNQFTNYIQKIFALIRTATGHDLSHYKQTTILRRIERRMAVHQIDRVSGYVDFLQKTSTEVDILFKDMLIGVTNFFRDPEAFKILKDRVIPDLLKRRLTHSTIRIWIIGCSTGEEAYSLAIFFTEAIEKLKQNMEIQIFASDIDENAIDYARSGIYPDSIAADILPEILNKYFIKEDNSYRVKKHIREMIIFAVQNVIKDPPFSKIDMVSCRNLLIYMDSELQKKVLPLFHYTLNSEGVLFLGTSESIGEFTDLFHPIDNKLKIFKRKDFYIERPVDYPITPFYQESARSGSEEKQPSSEIEIQNAAERIILESYAPPGVLVNEKYEIVQFMGKTDKYLETPVGKASFNIQQMAREGLRFKLTTALHNALRQKKTTVIENLRVKYNDSFRTVNLTVRPLLEINRPQNYILILFDDKTPLDKGLKKKGKKTAKSDTDPVITSLEKELASTREHLQTTIEEMETANEELKSTNEEMQSVNEELQSSNEELETSKEELQSSNEELVTVNTELQNKVDELSTVNNDINNLLASTDIGTVFLDTNLAIKRFTPAMTNIFNLINSDIGRPISDITSKIRNENLNRDGAEVLRTLTPKEMEMQADNGNWFSMRISPYRTIENVIDGIVITFIEITKIKENRRLAAVVKDSNDAITVQDLEGNITAWNKGAEKMFGYSEAEALSMNIRDIVPDDKRKEALAFVQKMQEDKEVDSFYTRRITKDGRILDVWLTVTKLVDDQGKIEAIATTERDVTKLKKSQEMLLQ